MYVESLATLTRKIMLTNAQAVVLPSVIENAAGKLGTTKEQLVHQLLGNSAAAEYIATVCRTVAS